MFGNASECSEKEWITFLLAFQRWTSSRQNDGNRDVVIPPGFALNLRKYLYEPQFSLNLPHAFHFKALGRTESTRFNAIYEFTLLPDSKQQQGGDLLRVKCVRRNDNDVHTLNPATRQITSKAGHYMSGTRVSKSRWNPTNRRGNEDDENSSMKEDTKADDWSSASHVLFQQWMSPDRWIKNHRRFLLLRPKNAEDCHRRMICKTANDMLDQGYSLLLFVGRDCVTVPLLKRERLSIAGMIWRDDDDGQNDDDKRETIEGDKQLNVPNEFSLIIAEGDRWRDLPIENDLLVWRLNHVYKFCPGRWKWG